MAVGSTGRRYWAMVVAGLAVAVVLCGFFLVRAAAAEPSFPILTGRIVDEAGLIKYEHRVSIEAELKDLESRSTDQVAVVTLKSLQGYPIEDYGYQLGRKWGIGQKGKDNGILLIVAPNERKVRIEVGRGLEPVMTDLMSRLIIENRILPAFRRGDFSAGIEAGVHDIHDVLLGDAEEVKKRARGGAKPSGGIDTTGLIMLAFWIAIVALAFYLNQRQMRTMQQTGYRPGQRQGRGGRRSRGSDVIVVPGGFGGGWSGGSSGDSGGGWSGGGGDFGGGGASGDW